MKEVQKLEGLAKRVVAILKRHNYEASHTAKNDLIIGKASISKKEKESVIAIGSILLTCATAWSLMHANYTALVVGLAIVLVHSIITYNRFEKKVKKPSSREAVPRVKVFSLPLAERDK
jgi:hypothetical protein